MTPSKKIYMDVLFYTKNKHTVDTMTWEEMCAFYHMIREVEGLNGKG